MAGYLLHVRSNTQVQASWRHIILELWLTSNFDTSFDQ
jgi:hypothetical protein